MIEMVVTISNSFEACDKADKAYYQSLTPQRRLEILFELNGRWPTSGNHAASGRLERVYRIVKLS
jgi:hypothetical protein